MNEEEADVEVQQPALASLGAQKKQFERDLPPHQSEVPTKPAKQEYSTLPSQRASKTLVIHVPKNARPPESRPRFR